MSNAPVLQDCGQFNVRRAGMPCGLCNTGNEPELEPGFRVTIDTKHGQRH